VAAQQRQEIEARIIRPAALVDWENIELPGLVGRRLFGAWHWAWAVRACPSPSARSGGRAPSCVVRRTVRSGAPGGQPSRPDHPHPRPVADAVPRPRLRGSILWVPISLLAAAFGAVRFVVGLGRRERNTAAGRVVRFCGHVASTPL